MSNKNKKYLSNTEIKLGEAKTLANPFWRSEEAIVKEFDCLPAEKQYAMLQKLAEKIGLHLP